jgi:hypothetical protein
MVIICLFALGIAWHKCNAQVVVGKGQSARTCSPITIFVKSKSLFELGNWTICADLAVNKNSLPYSRLGGNLLKQYHGSTPIYGSLPMSNYLDFECGAYLGMVANRAEALGERPLPANIDTRYDLGFDSGLVSGLSLNVEKFGRVRLRYNYGLSELLNADDRSIKTRRLDLGLDFRF